MLSLLTDTANMQAKLFMIPWIIGLGVRAQSPNLAQGLITDPIVDAHHRNFVEMLRRQQQINDALLRNNGLFQPIPLAHAPDGLLRPQLPQNPFNLFTPPNLQLSAQGSTSKLGSYDKIEEKEGTVKVPSTSDEIRKAISESKTVVLKQTNTTAETTTTTTETPSTTTKIAVTPTTSPTVIQSNEMKILTKEDAEVLELFKKLNLSKEETKSIVEHVEQVVREELAKKLKEAEMLKEHPTIQGTTASSTTSGPTTTTATTSTTTTTTPVATTTTSPKLIRMPKHRLRTEETVIVPKHEVKHHPKKKETFILDESDEALAGSIKTSLTHLPVAVVNDEEEREKIHAEASLHKRVVIPAPNDDNEDRDLLVDFVTGAPLDLNERQEKENREFLPVTVQSTSPPGIPSTLPTLPSKLPPRHPQHVMTNFERLASDYRRRLENTGDINKILQKISENAYISLGILFRMSAEECSNPQGFYSYSSESSRELSREDLEKLAKQTEASEFKKKKLEIEARKNWDKFYHRNGDNFFKDRNWSADDLKELCHDIDFSKELKYLEAGCGVGNMLFPLAAEIPNLKLFAFDFSVNAVKLLSKRAAELSLSVESDVVDLADGDLNSPFSEDVDLATLIFVLSAIHPEKHRIAVENMKKFVRIGGTVIIRDYGVNDHAMIRFGRESRLGDRFYVRQDGTRAYYFDLDELAEMFTSCGFRCIRKEYLHRITINHKKDLRVPRIFVQARFVRDS
ncbi:unnamed protein product [Caenorhabditis bovis]|uniref:Methyltransferase type 12 domain-containing protein n=1 Tax=Caenorhabditis bovis TaxID=2654633 RepID=A0A8S1EII3_9PELO|nr:unnamed protein product [Caenorhabditis bovis]